jgi:hypothetical protein
MSNDTIDITTTHRAVEHNSERLGDQYPFSVDTLAVGSTEARVFTPDNGRQHASYSTFGAEIREITTFTSSEGLASVTLELDINRDRGVRSVSVTLWGVTLDTLASAVEAAQREAASA